MKFRTYGVSTDQVQKVVTHIFADLYLRANEGENAGPEIETLIEMMKQYPTQCQMVMAATLIFAIGNFDRIEKIERWATLDENGNIDTENLEMLDPGFVV